MGWEWRYFVPSNKPVPEGNRVDIYFPCGASLGLKLRNGSGGLEEKRRNEVAAMPASAAASVAGGASSEAGKGEAERWKKRILSHRCVAADSGPPQLDLAVYAKESGAASVEAAFGVAAPPTPGLVVHCRKARTKTLMGEKTDCVLFAELDGQRCGPEEHWLSVSIEIDDLDQLARAVANLPPLPKGALVTGYPGLVANIAQRALALQTTTAAAAAVAGASAVVGAEPEADGPAPPSPPPAVATRVVFIDCDGVLSCYRSLTCSYDDDDPSLVHDALGRAECVPLERRCLANLKRATRGRASSAATAGVGGEGAAAAAAGAAAGDSDAAAATVVLSTTWRQVESQRSFLTSALHDAGIAVAGCTPQLPTGRGFEIEAWLAEHPEVTHYAVLEDDTARNGESFLLAMAGELQSHVVWTLMGKPDEVDDAEMPGDSAAAGITDETVAKVQRLLWPEPQWPDE